MAQQKIGAGHVNAMIRAGAKELAQMLPAFPTHGIQPVEEPGLAGNLTPQEVANDKGYEAFLNGYARRGNPEVTREMERSG